MNRQEGVEVQRFLYQYIELFSVLGMGTPENPGGDFSMYCWIEGPDKDSALAWGYVLLGDYCKARYARSVDGFGHDGSPMAEGEIVEDQELLCMAEGWRIPCCRVGEIPEWHEPWRISNGG